MVDVHERFARQANELARQAREAGNHPFGALLVLEGNVVASAQNTVFTGIRSMAYALPALELAKLAGGSFLVPCRELFARAAEPVTVIGPLSLNEARDVHLGYWPAPVAHES